MLSSPSGICTDSSGRIYIIYRHSNRILLFNSQHELLKVIGDEGRLKEPRGISLDPEGNIIICNSGKSCVQLLSSAGDQSFYLNFVKRDLGIASLNHQQD